MSFRLVGFCCVLVHPLAIDFDCCVFPSAGATLKFDVELVDVNQPPPASNVFKQIDVDEDNQLSKEEVCIVFFFLSVCL